MGIESKSWKMLRNFIDYSEEQIEEIRRKQREAHQNEGEWALEEEIEGMKQIARLQSPGEVEVLEKMHSFRPSVRNVLRAKNRGRKSIC